MMRSRCPTPATQVTPCHHFTQPRQCTKCHACHVPRCHHCTRSRDCDSRKTRSATHLKCCAGHAKCSSSTESLAKKHCACHTQVFSARLETRDNVRKCHAYHAKRHYNLGYAGLEASKSDYFCRTRYAALTRSPANGCDRKGDVDRTHPQNPDQSETGILATHSGKMWGASNNQWESSGIFWNSWWESSGFCFQMLPLVNPYNNWDDDPHHRWYSYNLTTSSLPSHMKDHPNESLVRYRIYSFWGLLLEY